MIRWGSRAAAVVCGAVLVGGLAGCSVARSTHVDSVPTHVRSTDRSPSPSPSATPSSTPVAGPAPTSVPGVLPGSATPRPATAGQEATPSPSPTLTSVPAGTVVAQGTVASPKGSIHFQYRMVSNGDDTYSVQYSGFTSTLPVPVSATLLEVAPHVGDGLTYHGVADHLLGGATTTPTASTASLGSIGQPAPLGTLVTYSSAPAGDAVPVEISEGKVLAVTPVHWSIPVRTSNVHPVDGGARPYADGVVTAETASGAPKRYLVAHGDTTAMVATRFGISVQDLIWLNSGLQVFGDQQYLYESTTLNLDPDSK